MLCCQLTTGTSRQIRGYELQLEEASKTHLAHILSLLYPFLANMCLGRQRAHCLAALAALEFSP